jgi:hypothetical protein
MCYLYLMDFKRGDSLNILISSIKLITRGEETGLCVTVIIEACIEKSAYTTRTIMTHKVVMLN